MTLPALVIDFGARQVPVYLGNDLISNADMLATHISGQRVVIVTQKNIADLHLKKLMGALGKFQCDVIMLPAGEHHKSLTEWQKILDTMIELRHDRTTTLIAFGGGVIGDITGFAAACYLRGVNYLQIPTTLIAQVDAAIGGKTAVNHPQGKNLVGVFYQPRCVITDVALLLTLPDREYYAGFAEVVKYGLAFDRDFFQWLEQNVTQLLARSPVALQYAVATSIRIKAQIVMQDEHDHDLRNLLNFGHTLGHALETASDYQKLLHGEAVAIGMLLAARLSTTLHHFPQVDVVRVKNLLMALHLPVRTELPSAEKLLSLLQRDKKVRAGKVKFILLTAIGSAIQSTDVTAEDIQYLYRAATVRERHDTLAGSDAP
jgi:3-dehydroquinate synthase